MAIFVLQMRSRDQAADGDDTILACKVKNMKSVAVPKERFQPVRGVRIGSHCSPACGSSTDMLKPVNLSL